MRESETNELLELGSFVKGGYSTVISNGGKIIAAITLIVAVLVTFTDVALSNFAAESFTTTLAVMLLSSYLMYFSLEDAGEREGEKCEEYLSANARYLAVRGKITPDMVDSLREFCLDYSKKEQEYRRLCYLSENGLSATDYAAYCEGEIFPRRSRRIFKRAEKIKAANLTPAMLLSRNHGIGKSELLDPGRDKIIYGIVSLIPSTICTVFTVSIILTAKDGLTAVGILEGLIKLCALPIVGFRGTVDGYNFVKLSKSSWLETKARLLEAFLAK